MGWPLACGPAAAAPVEVYGNLPSLDHVSISPDGTLLAYETTVGNDRAVLIVGIDDRKIHAAIRSEGQKIRNLIWADNQHLLTVYSTTRPPIGVMAVKQEWLMAASYDIPANKQALVLGSATADAMNVLESLPQSRTVDGRTTIYVTGIVFKIDNGVPALFAVDPDTGNGKIVESGNSRSLEWIVDDKGAPVAKTEYDESDQTWTLFLRQGDRWNKGFAVQSPIDTPDIEGISPDGTSILLAMPDGSDKQIRIADGAEQTAVNLGAYDAAIEDPVTHRIIGTERLDTAAHYHFVSHADQAAWDSIAGAYAGENVELVSWSADRKRIVVRVDGKNDGSEFELVDLNAHNSVHIGPVYKSIGPFEIAEVRRVAYPAADGMTIPGYLTLPNGKPAKNLPLVVLAHGGPAARDTPEFDWWSQALAAQGYAVLQPEFRGSAGFGEDFMEAGFGQWGRKMQTDLSDGVRYLAAQGIVDPKRVCIVGASYGGYAALAGAALDRGVYRCAVSVSGVSDPRGLLRWERSRGEHRDTQTLRYWDRFMGIADYDDPKLKEISPIEHVAQVDIPVLLIHGKDDTVVPIAQSEDMADALTDAHKPVTYVKLPGEDHWLSRPETRLKMLTETVNFLIANNPPD
jgi:dipeptidyl aminopeptidase/acylaminoacyl peptidase